MHLHEETLDLAQMSSLHSEVPTRPVDAGAEMNSDADSRILVLAFDESLKHISGCLLRN